MSDVFKEQIVKREFTTKDIIRKYLMIFTASAVTVIYFLLPFLHSNNDIIVRIEEAAIVGFVLAFVVIFFIRRMNREYEYIFTNGTLDIDCIYNKSSRRSKISIDVSEFILMAHIDDKERLNEYKNLPSYDFSSGEVLGNTYVFVCSYKEKPCKIIFEPNDEILEEIRLVIPRKLFRKK